MAGTAKHSGFSFADRSFVAGFVLGAALAAASVHYYHNTQQGKAVTQAPAATPMAEMRHYDFDDILRNRGEVPVGLPPPNKQAASIDQSPPQQSQPPPMLQKSAAEMLPASEAKQPAAVKPVVHSIPTKPMKPPVKQPSSPAAGQDQEPMKTAATPTAYAVHVQTFRQFEAAHALRQRLLSLGYEAFIKKTQQPDTIAYLVWMGPFDRLRADSIQKDLKQNGMLSSALVPNIKKL